MATDDEDKKKEEAPKDDKGEEQQDTVELDASDFEGMTDEEIVAELESRDFTPEEIESALEQLSPDDGGIQLSDEADSEEIIEEERIPPVTNGGESVSALAKLIGSFRT